MKNEKTTLIGRYAEKQFLETVFQSKSAEFIAVYGRRPIKKKA